MVRQRYNIDIRTGHEVTGVIPASRTITVTDRATGARFTDTYDELVLATGLSPVVPPVPGVTAAGVFTVRTPSQAEAKGVSGNAGQNILLRSGFRSVANLSGGNKNYQSYLRSRVG